MQTIATALRGRGVLIISHRRPEAQAVDRVVVLQPDVRDEATPR
jgi:ABC-type transport system involved in cytochrome bd biosynthesis fused ATPase/permease subunit